jgi:putative lipoic acid-binding regulatory protein
MTEPTLFEFPCDFPVKVMGRHTAEFRAVVIAIVERHAGKLEPERIQQRASKDGNFLSVTCTLRAESKAQLDALYRELTACQDVLYVL